MQGFLIKMLFIITDANLTAINISAISKNRYF